MSNKVPQLRFNGYSDAWVQRELSEVARYRNGKAHEKSVVETGPFVIVNSKFVSTEGQVRKYSDVDIEPLMEDEVAIVLSDVPNGRAIAKTFKVDRSGVYTLNQRIAALTAKENFSPSFLQLVLDRNRYFLKFDDGVSQTNLSKSDVLQFTTAYPTIEEQRRIGLLFESLDNLIAANQRKLDLLKEQKKGYLQKMFPKNGAKVPELRFAGFADDWEERKLSELATMNARIGWQNLRTSEFLDNGDYMLITGTDFKAGEIDYSNIHYVEKERFEQDKKIQISNKSILITKDGTLGKVAYVEGLTMPATLNAGVFNVRVKEDLAIDSKYLFHYLKAPFLLKFADQRSTGGTIKHLNQNVLVEFPIPLPSLGEQHKIAGLLSNFDNTIALHQRKLDLLKEQKKGYLQKMFAK
ncbi:restriction endonuclease subunit S [Leuconostoc holzapfelii]|uniref:Restriction endonuclease subunit S n=1 Tax=Leuconostoc holzapfelii TaxID=434464 RepID=A0A846ZIE1_9LACO|nr:restriction endonuclease subunit S [Leuconostoc holzapfelii]NKZ19222.1 restriction endonuclease subunit S [Leuconostoc holzapfelii]